MFSQVTPSLERTHGGLGIGLALVRGLIELHGGKIEARSEGPGRGSEFIVHLPVATISEQPITPDANGINLRRTPKQRRILVVEDNADSAASLCMMLQLAGHEIRSANDGREALQTAESFRPHIVLLDIGLPKLNGYEVARQIRKQPWGENVILIALTGWAQQEDKQRALEAGFDHHLTKPVVLDDILHLMAKSKQTSAADG
jgi:CheY-like chemotaxis protein